MFRKYRYRMVNFPSAFLIEKENRSFAAEKLEEIVHEWASKGWEFFRMDPFRIAVQQSCLGSLFGWEPDKYDDYVITFRIAVEPRINPSATTT